MEIYIDVMTFVLQCLDNVVLGNLEMVQCKPTRNMFAEKFVSASFKMLS